jgi:hypothetical protein
VDYLDHNRKPAYRCYQPSYDDPSENPRRRRTHAEESEGFEITAMSEPPLIVKTMVPPRTPHSIYHSHVMARILNAYFHYTILSPLKISSTRD